MSIDGIKQVLHEQPFRPFTFRMTSGAEYKVEHLDFISASGTYRRLFVARPNQDWVDTLDTLMIESVHHAQPANGSAS
jgi:hypothetical protein